MVVNNKSSLHRRRELVFQKSHFYDYEIISNAPTHRNSGTSLSKIIERPSLDTTANRVATTTIVDKISFATTANSASFFASSSSSFGPNAPRQHHTLPSTTAITPKHVLNTILNNVTNSILLSDSSSILGDNASSSLTNNNGSTTNFLSNLSELGLYGLHRNSSSTVTGNDVTSSGNADIIIPQIPDYIRYTSMVFCIVIMCLGVIGNIMVPIVILKTKDMRNSTNIFLTNLSIADLLVLLVCTPTVLVEVNTPPETWVLGHEMCKLITMILGQFTSNTIITEILGLKYV
uniref:CSON007190 protein n=1 Tax=Culicoides sonorensis TaxID=179676 RepID=A0A336MUN8_CULSO